MRPKVWLYSVLLGVLAGVVALVVAPPVAIETGLGKLEVSVRPGLHGTQIDIPPLGEVRAGTHAAPVEIHVALDRLEVSRAGEAVSTAESRENAIQDAEKDLHSAFVRYGLLCVAVSVMLAVLLARSRKNRGWRLVAVTVAAAVVPLVGMGTWVMATFDPEAFASPTFHGPLSEAPDVLKKLDSAVENVDELRNRLGVVTDQLVALTEPLEAERDSVVILHVSDLHSNAVGVAWVDELVKSFEPDVVLDTGDVTSFGVLAEGSVMENVLTTPKEKYMVVFGNHDSEELRRRLSERIESIDREVRTVKDVTILGMDDPTYTAKEGSQASDDPKYEVSGEELKKLCQKTKPTIVAVHNPNQAEYVDGCARVVLAGHTHTPEQRRLPGGSILSVSGTTGASGIEGLNPGGLYYAEILRFDKGVLHSVDVVEMNPTTGEVTIKRVKAARIQPLSP